jgi:P27 family predicted phage terminase small subunit
MRGRKPKPTALKRLAGNPGKRPLPAKEPKPQIVAMHPPEWLSSEGQIEWGRVSEMLLRLGVVTEADWSALAVYCRAWEKWVDAERKLQQSGLLIKSKSGYPIVNPLVGIAGKAEDRVLKALIEFGMTPSSRARVATGGPERDADPFSEFDIG